MEFVLDDYLQHAEDLVNYTDYPTLPAKECLNMLLRFIDTFSNDSKDYHFQKPTNEQ